MHLLILSVKKVARKQFIFCQLFNVNFFLVPSIEVDETTTLQKKFDRFGRIRFQTGIRPSEHTAKHSWSEKK